MPEELINGGSGDALNGNPGSSPDNSGTPGPADAGQPGSSSPDLSQFVPKSQYEELEKKLGSQGQELGDMRKWFTDVSPLLDKLYEQPEVIQAIMDGKVNSDLAKAVLEGKVNIGDATQVTQAHEEVKKEMGKKYATADPAEVEKRIQEKLEGLDKKIKETQTKFETGLKEVEERRNFMASAEEFIKSKPDYPDHAEAIVQWLEDNPNQYDISVAYYAVKGIAQTKQAEEEAAKKAGENAKNLAANAGGGQSQGSAIVTDKSIVDQLIAGTPNPNSL